MNRFGICFLFFIIPVLLSAQSVKSNKIKSDITFSGYVKSDMIYDTRQTVNYREGHFLLYPEEPLYDNDSNDINEAPNFNILAIETRLKGDITGPAAFGAKT